MNKSKSKDKNAKPNGKEEKIVKGKEKNVSDKSKEKSVKRKSSKSKDKTDSTVKKPMNAFMFFQRNKEKREEVAKKYELNGKFLVSKMGEIWRNMSDTDKEPFVQMSIKDKERYEREIISEPKKDSKSIKKSSKNSDENVVENKRKRKVNKKKDEDDDDDEDE